MFLNRNFNKKIIGDSMKKKTDIEIILESIAIVIADKERLKRVLIDSGIYDKDLKLIKKPNSQ